MLIACPSRAISYDIEAASQQPDGRQVRCVRCRTVWRAQPSRAERLTAAAEAIAPATQLAETAAPVADEFAVADAAMADSEIPAEAVDAPAPEFAAAEAESVADATAAVEAPPRVPVDLDRGGPVAVEAEHHDEPAPEPVEDIETYAARHDKRRSRFSLNWPLPNMHTGILALLIVDAILIGWRSDFVRVFPQTASLYATLGLPVNLRSVTFEDVATSTEQNEGVPILVVQGNIVNRGHRIVDVSRLKFVVRNSAKEEIYSWTAVPPRPSLPGGEAVGVPQPAGVAAAVRPRRAGAFRHPPRQRGGRRAHARGGALRPFAHRHPHADHGRHRLGAGGRPGFPHGHHAADDRLMPISASAPPALTR